jgi:tetratricopeptide (TPR) repeat protein
LKRGFKVQPDAFNSKWLGIIDLSQGFIDDAIDYLETSIRYDKDDAQVYFNITGAYAQKKEFQEAFQSITKCLQINPDFPRAKQIQEQLMNLLNE